MTENQYVTIGTKPASDKIEIVFIMFTVVLPKPGTGCGVEAVSTKFTVVFPKPGTGCGVVATQHLLAEQMAHLSQDFHGVYFPRVGTLHFSHLEHL